MSTSRHTLTQIIIDHQDIMRERAKKALNNPQIAARLFDEIIPIDTPEFIALTKNFMTIIENTVVNHTEGIPYLKLDTDKKAIEAFHKYILKNACDELLDKNGEINTNIQKILEWENQTLSQEFTVTILRAYTGAICAALISASADINFFPEKTALSHYTTQHAKQWAMQILEQHNKSFNNEAIRKLVSHLFKDILNFPSKNPGKSFVFGAAALGIFALGIKVLFSHGKPDDNKQSVDNKQEIKSYKPNN